ncbi:hypothetical protein GWI33_020270 [Rhynchophorus ferrugineus]|uniref:Uncharacterized protein n=1 Tax=Rhynchophorus ferrugineus TaxID=354439 RepID=A0A834HRH2_RHYFE|nr:hypothetical protein GWI33_020270 [Rhynchophorus ferrugineus]
MEKDAMHRKKLENKLSRFVNGKLEEQNSTSGLGENKSLVVNVRSRIFRLPSARGVVTGRRERRFTTIRGPTGTNDNG